MKRIFYLMFIGFLTLSLSYCSGDDGDIGPAGPQGEQGAKGEQGPQGDPGEDGKDGLDGQDGAPGIANVFYSDWISLSGSTEDYKFVADSTITQEIMDSGAILVYFRFSTDLYDGTDYETVSLTESVGGTFYTNNFFDMRYYVLVESDLDPTIAYQYSVPEDNDVQGPGILFNFNKYNALDHNFEVRYVLIPGGTPSVDPSAVNLANYQDVVRYFGIPK